MLELQQTVS